MRYITTPGMITDQPAPCSAGFTAPLASQDTRRAQPQYTCRHAHLGTRAHRQRALPRPRSSSVAVTCLLLSALIVSWLVTGARVTSGDQWGTGSSMNRTCLAAESSSLAHVHLRQQVLKQLVLVV
jgi:hypothetical protein